MLKSKLIASAFLLLPYIVLGIARADTTQSPVTVWVYETPVKGGVRYDYQMINRSPAPITSLVIGYSYPSESELITPPTGWSLEAGIPATSVSSPKGWAAKLIPTEESEAKLLEWVISSSAHSLPPGQSLKGFSILLPKSDRNYMTSHWTVYVNSAKAFYTGKLVPHNQK